MAALCSAERILVDRFRLSAALTDQSTTMGRCDSGGTTLATTFPTSQFNLGELIEPPPRDRKGISLPLASPRLKV
jgi:hypothetical protein